MQRGWVIGSVVESCGVAGLETLGHGCSSSRYCICHQWTMCPHRGLSVLGWPSCKVSQTHTGWLPTTEIYSLNNSGGQKSKIRVSSGPCSLKPVCLPDPLSTWKVTCEGLTPRTQAERGPQQSGWHTHVEWVQQWRSLFWFHKFFVIKLMY